MTTPTTTTTTILLPGCSACSSRTRGLVTDSERFIVVPLYTGVGIGNSYISLELAVTLAHVTGRTLILDTSLAPRNGCFAASGSIVTSRIGILDLFDVPVRVLRFDGDPRDADHGAAQDRLAAWLRDRESMTWTTPASTWPSCFLTATILVDTTRQDARRLERFRAGRTRGPVLNMTDLTGRPERIVRMRLPGENDPRSYYFTYSASLLYIEDPATSKRLVEDVWRKIRPRAVFETAVDETLTKLGLTSFQAAHIRRGDFLQHRTEVRDMDGQRLVEGLSRYWSPDKPTLVCSDESPWSDYWRPIRARFPQVRFATQLVPEMVRRWSTSEATAWVARDPTVHALLEWLVASRADTFVGTAGSTFSSAIQRERAWWRQRQRHATKETAMDDPLLYVHDTTGHLTTSSTSPTPFSWTDNGVSPDIKGWYAVPTEYWTFHGH